MIDADVTFIARMISDIKEEKEGESFTSSIR